MKKLLWISILAMIVIVTSCTNLSGTKKNTKPKKFEIENIILKKISNNPTLLNNDIILKEVNDSIKDILIQNDTILLDFPVNIKKINERNGKYIMQLDCSVNRIHDNDNNIIDRDYRIYFDGIGYISDSLAHTLTYDSNKSFKVYGTHKFITYNTYKKILGYKSYIWNHYEGINTEPSVGGYYYITSFDLGVYQYEIDSIVPYEKYLLETFK